MVINESLNILEVGRKAEKESERELICLLQTGRVIDVALCPHKLDVVGSNSC